MLLLVILKLILLVQGNTNLPDSGLYFTLNGDVYLPGDAVNITDIGQIIHNNASGAGTSLVCRTKLVNTQCCRMGDGGNVGEWFFPDGNMVPRRRNNSNANFVRSGSTHQVRLLRRNNILAPTGAFECRVPHSNGTLKVAIITITDPTTGSNSTTHTTGTASTNSITSSTTHLPVTNPASTDINNTGSSPPAGTISSGLIPGLVTTIIIILVAIAIVIICILVCFWRKQGKAKVNFVAEKGPDKSSDANLAELCTSKAIDEKELVTIDDLDMKESIHQYSDDHSIGIDNTYQEINENELTTENAYSVVREREIDDCSGQQIYSRLYKSSTKPNEASSHELYSSISKPGDVCIASPTDVYAAVDKKNEKLKPQEQNARATSSPDVYAVVDKTKKLRPPEPTTSLLTGDKKKKKTAKLPQPSADAVPLTDVYAVVDKKKQ